MITTLYRTARAMATWAGLTEIDAWPLISELKKNLRAYDAHSFEIGVDLFGGRSVNRSPHKAVYGFNFQETEPGVRATNAIHREYMAHNLCSFLQSKGIKAVLDGEKGVIGFLEYEASEDSKDKLIGLLNALAPERTPSH